MAKGKLFAAIRVVALPFPSAQSRLSGKQMPKNVHWWHLFLWREMICKQDRR
jgi:hypothetical protein